MLEDLTTNLFAAVNESGFYPEVATIDLTRLLAGAPARGHVVMTEVHVDDDGLQMEAQTVVLTDEKLIFWGAFEQAGDEGERPMLHTHNRVVPLSKISDIRTMATVSNPAEYTAESVPDTVRVVFVTDALDRLELEPLSCEDPECGGGHGFHAEAIRDALVIAETREAVGDEKIRELLKLAESAARVIENRGCRH